MATDAPASSPTHFASPARASEADLRDQIAQVTLEPVVDALLRSLGGAVVVLNQHRQIVSANARYLETLGIARAEEILGMRPGESLSCVHAWDNQAGCGTGEACASCGAAIAMVAALEGGSTEERECVITCGNAETPRDVDLRVRATALRMADQDFLLLTLQDVSTEKRREALERAFFHDVADLAAGLSMAAVQLEPSNPDDVRAAAADIRLLAVRLARELVIQRSLTEAQPRAGEPLVEPIDVGGLIDSLRALGSHHPAADGKRLRVDAGPVPTLETDRLLLERILGGMLLNALEATPRGGEVRLEVVERGGEVFFKVWNAGAMAPALLPRIFQRYFSTKPGPGRGQGTFLMKLFGERWLGGQVGFESKAGDGTTFWLRLPLRPGARAPSPLPLVN